MPHKPRKIISGGQTGVDRAALDVALRAGIDHGGWAPSGRLAEDGAIPERYTGLVETDSADPAERTRLNVVSSDATLIVSSSELAGGTQLTLNFAADAGKPLLHIDLSREPLSVALRRAGAWLASVQPDTLNIAGPRESEEPGIYHLAIEFLDELLGKR